MRCEECHGSGRHTAIIDVGPYKLPTPSGFIQCWHCNGSGIAYCCGDAGANYGPAQDMTTEDIVADIDRNKEHGC